MKNNKWSCTEDQWTPNFKWFLVDEGTIQYAFETHQEAITYIEECYLSHMLLTDINNIVNDTMLDVTDFNAWNCKIQRCVVLTE